MIYKTPFSLDEKTERVMTDVALVSTPGESKSYKITLQNLLGDFLTSLPSHDHDDRYYTESEVDTMFATATIIPYVVLLRDDKAAGVDGGGVTAGSWVTRDLNNKVADTGGLCVLSSNQFTLQKGIYQLTAMVPSYGVDGFQAKLRDITNSSDVASGTPAYSSASSPQGNAYSKITAMLWAPVAPVTYEIQEQVESTRAADGLGSSVDFGVNNVYTTVEIMLIYLIP